MKSRLLADIEREYILRALYARQGNRTVAARDLGISVRTIRLKVIQYRKEGTWVVPCQCQFERNIVRCQNHRVDLTPHPAEE